MKLKRNGNGDDVSDAFLGHLLRERTLGRAKDRRQVAEKCPSTSQLGNRMEEPSKASYGNLLDGFRHPCRNNHVIQWHEFIEHAMQG